jgi:DNA-binding response OmpR family regulator
MPGLSGFEVLQQIEKRDFHIIFQTAFDKFAIQAFEANACDYLLKPFSEVRFHASVDCALQRASILSIDNLETSIKKARGCIETMVARHGPELKMITVADKEIGAAARIDSICRTSNDHTTGHRPACRIATTLIGVASLQKAFRAFVTASSGR